MIPAAKAGVQKCEGHLWYSEYNKNMIWPLILQKDWW